jgi:hypothetical protein
MRLRVITAKAIIVGWVKRSATQHLLLFVLLLSLHSGTSLAQDRSDCVVCRFMFKAGLCDARVVQSPHDGEIGVIGNITEIISGDQCRSQIKLNGSRSTGSMIKGFILVGGFDLCTGVADKPGGTFVGAVISLDGNYAVSRNCEKRMKD